MDIKSFVIFIYWGFNFAFNTVYVISFVDRGKPVHTVGQGSIL